jgi:hypothetical protein
MTSNSDLPDTRSSFSAGVDETVVARARNFVPELRRRSEEIHALGRIPHDLFDRILAERLFGLSTRVATLHGLLVPATSLELYGRLRCGQSQKAAMV